MSISVEDESARLADLQKALAEFPARTEARGAMSNIARSPNRGRAFVASFLAASFLWALALSASPQLHARVHADAKQKQHECAVTLVAAGSYHDAAPSLPTAPVPAVQFSKIPTLTPQWVESPFLSARIFEHAPPVCA